VCKACDRCRLKKSKCDGSNPCSRCKADNAICVFGERKKSHDKVYPKGYVEMLEQQQSQLVAGLRELYRRLQSGERWPGMPLKESHGGHPLTHDILERLDLLQMSNDAPIKLEGFEEDLSRLQRRCALENGAHTLRRRDSMSEESEPGLTSSESSHGVASPSHSVSYSESFSHRNAPPTPPMDSPYLRSSQIATPQKRQPLNMPLIAQPGGINPMMLQPQWPVQQATLDQSMDVDFLSYSSSMPYDAPMFNNNQFVSQAAYPISSMNWSDSFNDLIDSNAMLSS